jgi:hypothetical protein
MEEVIGSIPGEIKIPTIGLTAIPVMSVGREENAELND